MHRLSSESAFIIIREIINDGIIDSLIMTYDDKINTFLTLRYQIALMMLTVITVIWGVMGAIISQTIEREPFIPYVLIILGFLLTIISLGFWRYFTHLVYIESAQLFLDIIEEKFKDSALSREDKFKLLEKPEKKDLEIIEKIESSAQLKTYKKFDPEKRLKVIKKLVPISSEGGLKHFDELTIDIIYCLIGGEIFFIIAGGLKSQWLYSNIFENLPFNFSLFNYISMGILLLLVVPIGLYVIYYIKKQKNSPSLEEIIKVIDEVQQNV